METMKEREIVKKDMLYQVTLLKDLTLKNLYEDPLRSQDLRVVYLFDCNVQNGTYFRAKCTEQCTEYLYKNNY